MVIERTANIDIPNYLSLELFDNVLKEVLPHKDFEIQDFDVTMATNPGDNYLTDVYKVVISYGTSQIKENKLSVVVKCMPETEGYKNPIQQGFKVYEKEKDMFLRILPQISQICQDEFFNARFYYATEEPIKLIVFEDLQEIGYRMADKKAGLDYEHCLIVMKKLGKFHATSMILAKTDSTLEAKYDFGVFHEKVPRFLENIKRNFSLLREIVKKWHEFEEIAVKLEKLEIKFIDKITECSARDNDSYRVLNHGDLWVNNILFKYEENTMEPVDAAFVDFQLNYFASPAIDLNYFIHTSPNCEIRYNRRDELIEEYYKSFASTLKILKYENIPTLDNLLHEIHRKEFNGFIASIIILPLVLMEKESFKEEFNQKMSPKINDVFLKCGNYQKSIKSILKRFDEIKLFD